MTSDPERDNSATPRQAAVFRALIALVILISLIAIVLVVYAGTHIAG